MMLVSVQAPILKMPTVCAFWIVRKELPTVLEMDVCVRMVRHSLIIGVIYVPRMRFLTTAAPHASHVKAWVRTSLRTPTAPLVKSAPGIKLLITTAPHVRHAPAGNLPIVTTPLVYVLPDKPTIMVYADNAPATPLR